MVAKNHFWSVFFSAKSFRATTINDVWPDVLFFSLVATMVSLVTEKTSTSLAISNQMLTVVGTVLGLVISFRTSSAYERYSDGRRMWTNIMTSSRNLAQWIWIHVPDERMDKAGNKTKSLLECTIEKKSMVNLIHAFSVAVKHEVRGEPGIYYEDLYPLVAFLPRYATHPPAMQTDSDMLPLWAASEIEFTSADSAPSPTTEKTQSPKSSMSDPKDQPAMSSRQGSMTPSARLRRAKTFDPESVLANVPCERPLRAARNPPPLSFYDYFPPLRIFKPIHKAIHPNSKRDQNRSLTGKFKKPLMADSNVPLEITLYLMSYLAWLLRTGLVTPTAATGISNALAAFQDTIANLERVRTTPLPFAYQVHLRLTVWLYLFFLPFQIVSSFKYLTIPATAFGAFLMLGFLEIGQQIENPFNYDLNDLDLDNFCLTIQREMQEITAHSCSDPSKVIFTNWNLPFAPSDQRNAELIVSDKTHSYWGPKQKPSGRESEDTEGASGAGVHAKAEGEDDDGRGSEVDFDDSEGETSIRRMLLKNWADVDATTREHHRKVNDWWY